MILLFLNYLYTPEYLLAYMNCIIFYFNYIF